MRTLETCLALPQGCRAALVGSGGKTTLLFYLAGQYATQKVLVSTTTKIGWPSKERYGRFLEEKALPEATALPGITLAAHCEGTGKKLSALPMPLLQQVAMGYDYVLLESDGSRNLPLKGWAPQEPVVPPWASHTVGLMPLWALGRPASEEIIHRLPLFCSLTGAKQGQPVQPIHLARAIAGQQAKGIFSAASGKKILFFSQVESEEALQQACAVLALLPNECRQSLWRVVAGSVHQNTGHLLMGEN